jgi:hypothetical protein
MNRMDFWLGVVVSSVVFGGASAIIATNKNRDGLGWFVLGFCFSLVGLIVICALSPAIGAKSEDNSQRKPGDDREFVNNPKDITRPWLG